MPRKNASSKLKKPRLARRPTGSSAFFAEVAKLLKRIDRLISQHDKRSALALRQHRLEVRRDRRQDEMNAFFITAMPSARAEKAQWRAELRKRRRRLRAIDRALDATWEARQIEKKPLNRFLEDLHGIVGLHAIGRRAPQRHS